MWAFGLYLVLAVLLERRSLGHLNSICACTSGPDPTEYMWGFVWFPHAILHGLNPFVTHELWAGSGGFDLARGTFTPAEALLAWPLTAVAGPLVAFNVVAILAPVLAAWAAYRLCLYLTGRQAASMVGGYLFGFSTYELGQLLGHLQLSVTFAIPVAVWLTLKRIDGAMSTRRYAALMGLILLFQLFTSTEVLLSFTLFGLVALGLGYSVASPARRGAITTAAPAILGAYALMAVVGSPYLYYALSRSGVTTGPISADGLSFFIPTWLTGLGSSWLFSVSHRFPGNLVEQGTYLGVPLIAIIGIYAWRARRSAAAKTLVLTMAVVAVCTLGDHLYLDGHRLIALPWALVGHVPSLKLLITVRFGVFLALLSCVIAAMWLATPGRHVGWRWLLAGLAVAFLLPNYNASLPGTSLPMFTTAYPTPTFFATRQYRRYLRPGEIVLPLPYGSYGYSLLWQARTDMYFRLASGRFPHPPADYPGPIALELMQQAPITPDAPALLKGFIAKLGVGAVIADPRHAQPWSAVLASLGLHPLAVGGILLYRIPTARLGA